MLTSIYRKKFYTEEPACNCII